MAFKLYKADGTESYVQSDESKEFPVIQASARVTSGRITAKMSVGVTGALVHVLSRDIIGGGASEWVAIAKHTATADEISDKVLWIDLDRNVGDKIKLQVITLTAAETLSNVVFRPAV